MNVNPFSYLMNKISQKVSKSGDTMTGKLNIEKSGESYVRAVNTDKQVGAYLDADTNAEHGVWSNGYNNGSFQSLGRWLLKRGTNGDVYVNDTKVPYNGGTLALTSDLSNKTRFIKNQQFIFAKDTASDYTTTADCYMCGWIKSTDGTAQYILFNDVQIMATSNSTQYLTLPVKKGTKVTTRSGSQYSCDLRFFEME